MRTKTEYVEEAIRFRYRQIEASIGVLNYNLNMILDAEVDLIHLKREAQVDSIVKLCLTGK
jgi:hypothetical protein